MFKDTRTFLAALALVIAGGLLYSYFTQTKESIRPRAMPEVDERLSDQLVDRRDVVVQPEAFEQTGRLAPDGEIPLFGPLIVEVDRAGRLVVADHGDLKIKLFDAELQPIGVYGNGRGQGPGEHTTLTDVDVTLDGEVWAVDAQNGRISIFEPDGTLRRTLRSEHAPYRLALDAHGGGFTSMLNSVDDRLFGRFDADATLEHRHGQLIEDQARSFIALDARLAAYGDGRFAYAGTYAGILAAYEANGEPIFLRRTIEARPLPTVLRRGSTIAVDPDSLHSAISFGVVGDSAWIFTYTLDGFDRIGFIDFYDLVDGSYRESWRLPEATGWVAVGDGVVYTVADDIGIHRWVRRAADS